MCSVSVSESTSVSESVSESNPWAHQSRKKLLHLWSDGFSFSIWVKSSVSESAQSPNPWSTSESERNFYIFEVSRFQFQYLSQPVCPESVSESQPLRSESEENINFLEWESTESQLWAPESEEALDLRVVSAQYLESTRYRNPQFDIWSTCAWIGISFDIWVKCVGIWNQFPDIWVNKRPESVSTSEPSGMESSFWHLSQPGIRTLRHLSQQVYRISLTSESTIQVGIESVSTSESTSVYRNQSNIWVNKCIRISFIWAWYRISHIRVIALAAHRKQTKTTASCHGRRWTQTSKR